MVPVQLGEVLLMCLLLATPSRPQHDSRVDEEVFRGRGGGPYFEDLSPEQAEREIRRVVSLIDTDGDKQLSREELIAQVVKIEEGYFSRDLEDQWKRADSDGDGYVSQEEYRKIYEHEVSELLQTKTRKKFETADRNSDERLDKTEFDAFLHPDLYDHMQQHLVEEYLQRHDTNSDGFIDYDEYMTIFLPKTHGPNDELPAWIESEKKEFVEFLDQNGDNKLDFSEVRVWLTPDTRKFAAEEADHLLEEMDTNEDGVLSLQEIADNFDVLLDSEVTDFGHSVHGQHDEL